jgi:hypothetical protein
VQLLAVRTLSGTNSKQLRADAPLLAGTPNRGVVLDNLDPGTIPDDSRNRHFAIRTPGDQDDGGRGPGTYHQSWRILSCSAAFGSVDHLSS